MEIPWDDIRKDYFAGAEPRELAEKYKVNFNTLYGRISKKDWNKRRKEIKQEADKRIVQKSANSDAIAIQKMKDKERKNTDLLETAVVKKILITRKNADTGNEETIINPTLSPQGLAALSVALKRIQEIKYRSYGIPLDFKIHHAVSSPVLREQITKAFEVISDEDLDHALKQAGLDGVH
jgi:hypothetical protein